MHFNNPEGLHYCGYQLGMQILTDTLPFIYWLQRFWFCWCKCYKTALNIYRINELGSIKWNAFAFECLTDIIRVCSTVSWCIRLCGLKFFKWKQSILEGNKLESYPQETEQLFLIMQVNSSHGKISILAMLLEKCCALNRLWDKLTNPLCNVCTALCSFLPLFIWFNFISPTSPSIQQIYSLEFMVASGKISQYVFLIVLSYCPV